MLNHERLISMLGKDLIIYPLNLDKVKSASVDLTLGSFAWSLNTTKRIFADDSDSKTISILAKETICILTKETLALNNKIVGIVFPKLHISSRGVIMNSTLVEPNYTGCLMLTLYNSSDSNLKLDLDKSVARLVLSEHEKGTSYTNNLGWVHYPAISSNCFEMDDIVRAGLSHDYLYDRDKLLEKFKLSSEYSKLVQIQNEQMSNKASSKFKQALLNIAVPIIVIIGIIVIYISNVSIELKTAIPSIIAVISLLLTLRRRA